MVRSTFYLFAATSVLLSACNTTQSTGVESINQPVISRTDYVIDLRAGGYEGLSAEEAGRLDGWFSSLALGYGDTVYLDDPAGYADPARRAQVASIAARYGLLVPPGAPVTQGSVPDGSLRVIVSRTGASVPNCPNWSNESQPNFDGSAMSNYGCAVNGNLAAMIANPEDLIRGREAGGTTDAAAATKALTAYRTAEPTGKGGLKNESAKGGK